MNSQSFSTLAGRVYDTLRSEIAHGHLPPGTRLVRRSIAKQLKVSPIPVTEALLRLESDGLVESAPMYGSRVIAVSAENALDDLALREALECQAARECAMNVTGEALALLTTRAQRIDAVMQAGADPHDKTHDEAHGDFHLSIARASGRSVLARELRRLWFRRYMHLAWINAAEHGIPACWHQQLVAAIATRDPARAEAHMRFHVRWGTPRHQDQPNP